MADNENTSTWLVVVGLLFVLFLIGMLSKGNETVKDLEEEVRQDFNACLKDPPPQGC